MAYQHSIHAPILRQALLSLKHDNVGALFLLKELSRTWKPANPNDRMSRQALEGFTGGRDSKKVVALSALWDFLRAHDTYQRYFPKEQEPESEDVHDLLLGNVLARFCRGPFDYPWPPEKDDARFGFVGDFVMFSPPWNWDGDTKGNILHVMEMSTQIGHGNFGTDITHKQKDGSATVKLSTLLLPWRSLICFAGRQWHPEEGKPAIAHIGVVTETSFTPGNWDVGSASRGVLDTLLLSFKGVLTATAQVDRFPFVPFGLLIPFFCRRCQYWLDDHLWLEQGEMTTIYDGDPDKKVLEELFSLSQSYADAVRRRNNGDG